MIGRVGRKSVISPCAPGFFLAAVRPLSSFNIDGALTQYVKIDKMSGTLVENFPIIG